MFRTLCPVCRAEFARPDDDEGRAVPCPRCQAEVVAVPLPERAPAEPRRGGGEGSAILAFLLGILAMATFFCGIGGVFGLLGLLLGFAGLKSRFRGLSILGMVMSLVGAIFSLGVVAVFIVMKDAMDRETAPHPNGTKAPFADR